MNITTTKRNPSNPKITQKRGTPGTQSLGASRLFHSSNDNNLKIDANGNGTLDRNDPALRMRVEGRNLEPDRWTGVTIDDLRTFDKNGDDFLETQELPESLYLNGSSLRKYARSQHLEYKIILESGEVQADWNPKGRSGLVRHSPKVLGALGVAGMATLGLQFANIISRNDFLLVAASALATGGSVGGMIASIHTGPPTLVPQSSSGGSRSPII